MTRIPPLQNTGSLHRFERGIGQALRLSADRERLTASNGAFRRMTFVEWLRAVFL